MYVWIDCPQFHQIGVWITYVPSSKIPKRDSGSHVSKMGVNLYEIAELGLMTQASKDSSMNMQKSVQRCKETKKAKWGAQSKQGKHNIARSRERKCIKKTNIIGMCSLKWLHPNKPQTGWMQQQTSKWPQRPTSASPWRAQSMAKPRSRQANMDIKHQGKQAYTCIKKIIQIL